MNSKITIEKLLQGDYKYTKIIFQYIFDYTLGQIFRNKKRILTTEEIKNFYEIQDKLNNGLPLQYALGKWNFYGRDFVINENVLIPRPETELIVDNILREDLENKTVLDIGTGSGAIAISLALESKAKIYASDISNEALKVAKINAKNFNASVEFFNSNLYESIEKKFDYIVSNPPYLSEKEYEEVDKILYKEPKVALVGGKTGYEIYIEIIKESKKYLNEGGKIFLEIGYTQANIVSELLLECGYTNIKIIKDYNNLDRIVIGELCLNN